MAISKSQGLCMAMAERQDIAIAAKNSVVALVDGGTDPDTITSSNTGTINFLTKGFCPGDKITVLNATNAADDIDGVVCTAVAAGVITLPTGTFAAGQAAGSTALAVLASKGGSLRDIFQGATLSIFKGTKPATADDVCSSADELIQFTDVVWGAASWDSVNKKAIIDLLATLTKNALLTGTAVWFRLTAKGNEIYAASSSAIRMDGTVGSSGDLTAVSTSITQGAPQAVTSFKLRVPQA